MANYITMGGVYDWIQNLGGCLCGDVRVSDLPCDLLVEAASEGGEFVQDMADPDMGGWATVWILHDLQDVLIVCVPVIIRRGDQVVKSETFIWTNDHSFMSRVEPASKN